jgi:hypothetical protein
MIARWIKIFCIIGIVALGCLAEMLVADDQRTATTIAKWSDGTNRYLEVNMSDLLTPSQRDIVNSGFSTFTLLAISAKPILESEILPETRLACSVKYDTWEENYQMIRVDPPPVQNLTTKDYKTWANECLRYVITNQAILDYAATGATLNAILQIRQSSPDEASKIKNWLVKQQSGFMQGLYSHMLGDFQFRGTVKIKIQVPSIPVTSSARPSQLPSPPKGM